MSDLGKEEGGTSLASAGNKIVDSLYDAIIGAVGSATGFAGDTLKGFGSLTLGTLGTVVDGVTGKPETAETAETTETTETTEDPVEETVDDDEKKSTKRRAGGRRRLF